MRAFTYVRTILVANRGEIALRVICACKNSPSARRDLQRADEFADVRFADEAICIGPPNSRRVISKSPRR